MTGDNSWKHVPALKKGTKKGIQIFLKLYSFWSNSMKNLIKVARLPILKTGFSLFLTQDWEGGSSVILRILSLWSTLHLGYQSCIWIFFGICSSCTVISHLGPSFQGKSCRVTEALTLSECLLTLFCFMQKRRRKQSQGMTRVKEQVLIYGTAVSFRTQDG